jgi:hypothetical protein
MVVKKLNDLCYYKKFIQIHLIHIKKIKAYQTNIFEILCY